VELYSSILSISADADHAVYELRELLSSVATSCSDNFAAALDIHASESSTEDILTLLDNHSHLLRPRDANALQSAVAVLSDTPLLQAHGLQIIRKELLDTARAIHSSLLSCFSNVDEVIHREEIRHIAALRMGSSLRHDRIEQWVDAIVTPGSQPPNPMNFAAILMGLPLPPGLDDGDDDPLGHLDVDQNDPDLEDLREEFRPNLKERFEGWSEMPLTIQGGQALLIDIYVKLTEMMPFLHASDAVDEMIARLADKPSKHHICDALDALSTFSKLQKKTMLRDKKRKTDTRNVPATASTPHPAVSMSPFPNATIGFAFSFNQGGPIPSSSSMYSPGIGGMEDID